MENSMEFSPKTKNRTTIDPAIPSWGCIWNTNLKRYMHSNVHSSIIIASVWMQPKCLSTDEWMKKILYTHTHTHTHTHTEEYYSVIKMNEILPFATMWLGLESIILNEISQTEKHTYCLLSLTCEIWKIKQMNNYNKTETDSQT